MAEATSRPRIAPGADHAGYPLKEAIRKHLECAGYRIEDLGTWSEESVDYPDLGRAVGERVAPQRSDLGIAICGTGIGISIAANKVPGIRAALAHDVMTARLSREHNDANVLAVGRRIVTETQTIEIVEAFLSAQSVGGRHQRRIDKITEFETGERGSPARTKNAG